MRAQAKTWGALARPFYADSHDSRGKEEQRVSGHLGSQAGCQSALLRTYVESRLLPSWGSRGLPRVGDKYSVIYNHTNKCQMASVMSAVNEREDGLLECMAEGRVESRRMGKSLRTQSGTGGKPLLPHP